MRKIFVIFALFFPVVFASAGAYPSQDRHQIPFDQKKFFKQRLIDKLGPYAREQHYRGRVQEAANIYQKLVNLDPSYPVPQAYQGKVKIPLTPVPAQEPSTNNHLDELETIEQKMTEMQATIDQLDSHSSDIAERISALDPTGDPQQAGASSALISEGAMDYSQEDVAQEIPEDYSAFLDNALRQKERIIRQLKEELVNVLKEKARLKEETFDGQFFEESVKDLTRARSMSLKEKLKVRDDSILYLKGRIALVKKEINDLEGKSRTGLKDMVSKPFKPMTVQSVDDEFEGQSAEAQQSLAKMEYLKAKTEELRKKAEQRNAHIEQIQQQTVEKNPSDG